MIPSAATQLPADDPGLVALRDGAAVFSPPFGTIRADGRDRVRFLQGQLTPDVAGLAPGAGAPGFMLDLKGRIQSQLQLLCQEDHLLLVTGLPQLQATGEGLARFVISEDVDLDDEGARRAWLAVEGPAADQVVAEAGLPLPGAAPLAHAQDGARLVARASWSGAPGLWVLAPLGERDSLQAALLAAGAVPASDEAVEVQRVCRGVGRCGVDFGERSLPQETGLLASHVAFDKGCYRGQETVERVRSRGGVQRALTAVSLSADPGLPLPAPVNAADESRAVGELTSLVAGPDGWRGLATVRKAFLAPGAQLTCGAATLTPTPASE